MTNQPPPLRALIAAAQEQMRIDFERKSAVLSHPGEKGGAREDVLRSFLEDYLPDRFGVSTGFVVDANGSTSGQIDVVLFDKPSCPILRISEHHQMFPAEAVAGVVSVKSSLDRANLIDALSNVSTVINLDRFASQRPHLMLGGVPGQALPGYDGPALISGEPIFAAIFGYDSPPLPTVARNLNEWNQSVEPFRRVTLVCVLGRGIISHLENDLIQPTYSPSARLVCVEDAEIALPAFYSMLANNIIRKLPTMISFNKYLGLDMLPVTFID